MGFRCLLYFNGLMLVCWFICVRSVLGFCRFVGLLDGFLVVCLFSFVCVLDVGCWVCYSDVCVLLIGFGVFGGVAFACVVLCCVDAFEF